MRTFLSMVAICFLISCSKEKEEENRIAICFPGPDSTVYKGKFERSAISGVQSSDVILKLKDNVFSGTSIQPLFPAIGTGTFSTTSSTVSFKNQTMWTANFDWTLILDGTFDVRVNGDSLILTKFRGYDFVDTYSLKRQ